MKKVHRNGLLTACRGDGPEVDAEVSAVQVGALLSGDDHDMSSESEMESEFDASFHSQVGGEKPVDQLKESPERDLSTEAGAMSFSIYHSSCHSQAVDGKPVHELEKSPERDLNTEAGALSFSVHHSSCHSQAGAPKPGGCVGENGGMGMDAGITSQVGTSESVAGHNGSPVTDSETSFPSKALGLTLVGLSAGGGNPGVKLDRSASETQTVESESLAGSPS